MNDDSTKERVPSKAEARKAWNDLHRHQGEMTRLRTYPRMNVAMRNKFSQSSQALNEARSVLDAFFGSTADDNSETETAE